VKSEKRQETICEVGEIFSSQTMSKHDPVQKVVQSYGLHKVQGGRMALNRCSHRLLFFYTI